MVLEKRNEALWARDGEQPGTGFVMTSFIADTDAFFLILLDSIRRSR